MTLEEVAASPQFRAMGRHEQAAFLEHVARLDDGMTWERSMEKMLLHLGEHAERAAVLAERMGTK